MAKSNLVKVYFTKTPKGYAYNEGEVASVPEAMAEKLIEQGVARHPKLTLPEDIPHREALLKAGLESLAQVKEHEDLKEIKGIGEKDEKEIAEYLAG